MIRKPTFFIALVVLIVVFSQTVFAQDVVTVPDLKGLNVPQAAAALNRGGLMMGAQINTDWNALAGVPQNTVGGQSIAAGQTVARGTPVDITIMRAPNVVLIYDDNDFTLVNLTGADLSLADIVFSSVDGSSPASFQMAELGSVLADGNCAQVWSIGVTSSKEHPECHSTFWRTTNQLAKHFWTGANGATRFSMMQGGVERAVCPVSTSGRCGFFMPGSVVAEAVTEYVYFAYTADRLAVINTSKDRWMPTGQLRVYNQNFIDPNQPLYLGDPTLFTGQSIIGDLNQLAPGQCLFFTKGAGPEAQPPQPCDVIARLDISPDLIFWSKSFDMDSLTDSQRRTCPAANDGLTLCIMPR